MRKATLLLLALTFGCVTAFDGVPVTPAEAASTKTKKKTKGRDDYTAEQRKKLMEEAKRICERRYGKGSRVYKIDYRKMTVICYETGW